MRVFIVLALIALARADVGGYNYEASQGGSGNIGGGIGGGHTGSSSSHGGLSHAQGPAEVEKEFYSFTAPEGEFEDTQPLNDLASSAKKNLQVIFIRGPENNNLADAVANLAKSAGDSRTAIYVLTKQNDVSDLANKLQNANDHKAQKPEVHFVKYRTPEDAAHAEQAIKSQYDGLGGSSHSHNGGVAPVLDYASKPAAHAAAPSSSYIPPQAPRNTYLPIIKY